MERKRGTRLLALLLVLTLLLTTFTACKKDDDEKKKDTSSKTTTSAGTETTSAEGGTETTTGKSSGGSGGSGGSSSGGKQESTTAAQKSNTYYAPSVLGVSAPGTAVETLSDGSQIDHSNTADGYIMVKYAGSYPVVRVQVTTPSGSKPLYAINTRDWVAIPLTNGNGTYHVNVLYSNDGSGYYSAGEKDISVSLSYSTVAFLRPNVNCWYTASTACVQYAAELTRGHDTELSKVEVIYNYVVENFSYDYSKASSVSNTTYVPNLDSVWSSKSGICFDYASTMAAMLRTQGIPTQVCAGNNSSGGYHCWINVYVKESGWVNGIIQFSGGSWKLMDPTFASTGGNKYDWSTKSTYSTLYWY